MQYRVATFFMRYTTAQLFSAAYNKYKLPVSKLHGDGVAAPLIYP